MYQFIIILDEIKGIRYSQNELNNGNLTAIQLVNYLKIRLVLINQFCYFQYHYLVLLPVPDISVRHLQNSHFRYSGVSI